MRVPNPRSDSQVWGLALGRAPRAFGVEGQQDMCAAAPQDWGKQGFHSRRGHTGFYVWWVLGQSKNSFKIWVRTTCRSWNVSLGTGVSHCRGRTLEAEVLGMNISVSSLGGCHFGKILPHPSGLEAPCQTSNGVGTQPTHQQTA